MLLVVEVPYQIIGITNVELNIDGEKSRYNSTDFRKSAGLNFSSNYIQVSVGIIDDILNSKQAWIRIGTTKGTMENAIIDRRVDSKAYHALRRFRDSINE